VPRVRRHSHRVQPHALREGRAVYIVAEKSADPLSPAASYTSPILARSHAYDILYSELERYTLGDIAGRSVLVAGHRGSGKTTLVYHAIQSVRREFRDEQRPRRPLLVQLHGPNLLPPDPDLPDLPTSGDGKEPNKTREEPLTPPQRVLIQITTALYRALATEVEKALREAVETRAARLGRGDLRELAGHVTLEFDDAPSAGVLRELWLEAGVLNSGVLFPHLHSADQGIREIVALSTAAQAFRVVSGNYKETEKFTNESTAQQKTSVAAEAKLKDVINPLFGLLTGGVVGTGLLLGTGAQAAGAGIAALLAAVTTTLTLNFSSTRTRTTTKSKEQVFLRDRRVSTLDRELPVLMQRVHDAGLAPVFVVDELDKVDDLHTRMRALVAHLKHFVTERAFFCFLTNRDYFEYLEEQSRTHPYPQEHTYFPHRLFVSYRPIHLHQFLDTLLPAKDMSDGEPFERVLLFYRVLHKARLHMFDLKRELSKLANHEGNIDIPSTRLTSIGYRFHIMIEMAIELLLNDSELGDRLDQDPHFGQLAYDALYYPSRVWADGNVELDLSEEAFKKHLIDRIVLDRSSTLARDPESGEPKGVEPSVESVIGKLDFPFLYERVQQLVALLMEPERLVDHLRSAGSPLDTHDEYWSSIVDVIPRNHPESADEDEGSERPPSTSRVDLRLLESKPDNVYAWRYDVFGRSLTAIELDVDAFKIVDSTVRALDDFIRRLTGGQMDLARLAELGVIAQTPPWSRIDGALARLNNFADRGVDYADREEDQIAIEGYMHMLEQHGRPLGIALVRGGEIGHAAGKAARAEQLVTGLASLGAVMKLPGKTPQDVESALEGIGEPVQEDIKRRFRLRRNSLSGWTAAVEEVMEQVLGDAEVARSMEKALP